MSKWTRLAMVLGGLGLGGIAGCEAARFNVVPAVVADAVRALCIKQLGACGAKSVWYNRCTGHVEIHDADGFVTENLRAWEIADAARPGVETVPVAPSSAGGAHVDAPKVTKAWRCKRRGSKDYCHLYRAADSAFGAFVQMERLPLTKQSWSRRWCPPERQCDPMEVEL